MTFLKMLFFDHLQNDQPSLQQHASCICDDHNIKVSKQAIDKRFNDKTVEFIKKILENFLNHSLLRELIPSDFDKDFSGIRIMDSTEFKLPANLAKEFPGYSGDGTASCAAIQFEYDVMSRQIKCMSLGNATESDKTFADKRMEDIQPKELIIRDLGYYSIDSYKKIEQQKAFYVSRLKAQISIYDKTDKGYHQLNWSEIILLIKKSKGKCFDRTVYIGSTDKKPVRLMAWLLDETAQNRRLQQKKNRKGKLNETDEIWSQLNVFITNVSFDKITPQQAYNIYKIRWQIELIFKIWKSILKINLIRKMKASRFRCYVYSKLLWVLLSWDISTGFEPIIWKKTKKLISLHKCYALLKNKVEQLKYILFDNHEKLKEWMYKMFHCFIDFGLKENKKNRVSVDKLLQIKRY
jgi:hypothetical protein